MDTLYNHDNKNFMHVSYRIKHPKNSKMALKLGYLKVGQAVLELLTGSF